MDRRRYLATSALLFPAVTAGCLSYGDSSRVPDGMSVETHYRTGSHLVDDGLSPSGEQGRTYETIIADRETALDRTREAADVREFVDGTDFEQSYLAVVVAAAWQSGYWLELAGIERTDDGLHVAVEVVSPDEPVGDDAATHSLAVRVTDEESGVPEGVGASVGD